MLYKHIDSNQNKNRYKMDKTDLIEILDHFGRKEGKSKRPVRLSDLKSSDQFKITEELSVLPWKTNYWIENKIPLDEKQYYKRLSKRRISSKPHDKNIYKPNQIIRNQREKNSK